MLAAAPKSPERAITFRLALTLISENKEAPARLVVHFNEILRQAKLLLDFQGGVPFEILPEAADVAFEIKVNSSLAKDIDALTEYAKITPHMASTLLEKINVTHALAP
jgi:hypothetical protein